MKRAPPGWEEVVAHARASPSGRDGVVIIPIGQFLDLADYVADLEHRYTVARRFALAGGFFIGLGAAAVIAAIFNAVLY